MLRQQAFGMQEMLCTSTPVVGCPPFYCCLSSLGHLWHLRRGALSCDVVIKLVMESGGREHCGRLQVRDVRGLWGRKSMQPNFHILCDVIDKHAQGGLSDWIPLDAPSECGRPCSHQGQAGRIAFWTLRNKIRLCIGT